MGVKSLRHTRIYLYIDEGFQDIMENLHYEQNEVWILVSFHFIFSIHFYVPSQIICIHKDTPHPQHSHTPLQERPRNKIQNGWRPRTFLFIPCSTWQRQNIFKKRGRVWQDAPCSRGGYSPPGTSSQVLTNRSKQFCSSKFHLANCLSFYCFLFTWYSWLYYSICPRSRVYPGTSKASPLRNGVIDALHGRAPACGAAKLITGTNIGSILSFCRQLWILPPLP